jgi:hypothetical protein
MEESKFIASALHEAIAGVPGSLVVISAMRTLPEREKTL